MNPSSPGHAPQSAALGCPVLVAPTHWRSIDFISDLHLQAAQFSTFEAWRDFLQSTTADAVFILGDLFEVWVGDDVLEAGALNVQVNAGAVDVADFEARCAEVLQAASKRLDIFFIHGNRDFLIGPAFAKACGLTLLADPCTLDFGGQRWLLSHGDALCLADTDYLQFRVQVRSTSWQQGFLQQPLSRRQAIALQLRLQSQTHQQAQSEYADVDAAAARDWLRTAHASTLIHGHTHRPGNHELGQGLQRIVLSDWDLQVQPPRAEVLRLHRVATAPGASVTVERLAWPPGAVKD